jgi:hypothetical protein
MNISNLGYIMRHLLLSLIVFILIFFSIDTAFASNNQKHIEPNNILPDYSIKMPINSGEPSVSQSGNKRVYTYEFADRNAKVAFVMSVVNTDSEHSSSFLEGVVRGGYFGVKNLMCFNITKDSGINDVILADNNAKHFRLECRSNNGMKKNISYYTFLSKKKIYIIKLFSISSEASKLYLYNEMINSLNTLKVR